MVNCLLYCPPTRLLRLPHMHVTKTKKLVISIWHLAILIRVQCPMVLSSSPLCFSLFPSLPPPFTSPLLPSSLPSSLLWFPSGWGPQTTADTVGIAVSSHLATTLVTKWLGKEEGQAERGAVSIPAVVLAWPKTTGPGRPPFGWAGPRCSMGREWGGGSLEGNRKRRSQYRALVLRVYLYCITCNCPATYKPLKSSWD